MKGILHKTASVIMAFVVLFSTMSFTINMHYCGDTLVETAVFHKAKGCGMEMENPSTKGCSIIKKNCCDDKQLSIEGQDELQITIDKISFERHVFIASFVYSYIYPLVESTEKESTFDDYPPPFIVKKIYKLDEVFLI